MSAPLLRALRGEMMKLRGTLALYLCAIAPFVVVALVVLQWLVAESSAAKRTPEQAWFMFSQGTMVFWAFLMLPLFITLQSALLAGLEHGERQWKHLLALPLPRHVHYLAKLLVLGAMVACATGLLVAFIAGAGALLAVAGPEKLALAGAPPWLFLITRAAATLGAAWLIIALHTWIAIRWSSFTIAVSVGMTATVMGFLIGQSQRFGHLYPWTMPMQVFAADGGRIGFLVATGLIAGTVVAVTGVWTFSRRDMA